MFEFCETLTRGGKPKVNHPGHYLVSRSDGTTYTVEAHCIDYCALPVHQGTRGSNTVVEIFLCRAKE